MRRKILFLIFFMIQFLFSSEEYPVSPYIDEKFELPWGKESFFVQSWRSYLETVPGKKFLEGIGMVVSMAYGKDFDYDSLLKFLSEIGVKNVRYEIAWTNVPWNEDKLLNEEMIINFLKSCKKYGIKPLILLNTQAIPGPVKYFWAEVLEDVKKGDREIGIKIDPKGEVKEGYTAIYTAPIDIFITSFDGEKATLSRPAFHDLKKGEKIRLRTYKYLPAHPVGTKEFEEMVEGWLKYVKLVCETCEKAGLEDKDFELEIFNELLSASPFINRLGINNYYDPPKVKFVYDYAADFLYEGGHGWEISKRTVDYVKENYPETRVIWGASNTAFHHTPIFLLPPKIDAKSGHPYGTHKVKIPEQFPPKGRYSRYIEKYIPKITKCMPEGWAHLAIQCENYIHGLQPEARGKSKPRGTKKFYYYMTELGWSAGGALIFDEKEALEYKAKCIIRGLLFWINKGFDKIYVYISWDRDNLGWSILNANYKEEGFSTPATKALSNMVSKFKDSKEIKNLRQLDVEVTSIGEQYKVFEDLIYIGKEEEKEKIPVPSLYYRDMFTFLPFQITDNKFICGVYVMSYDLTKPIPPMKFRLKIKNVYGEDSDISYYDPLIDKEIPFKIIDKGKNYLNIEIEAVDYPRLIIIEEDVEPLMIKDVKIKNVDKNKAEIYISTNIPAKVSIDYNFYNYSYKLLCDRIVKVVGMDYLPIPSKTVSSDSFLRTTPLEIEDLLPGQKYEFRVLAEDKKGVKILHPYLSEEPYFFTTKSDPNAPVVGLKVEYYISNKPGEFSELKYSEISPVVSLDNIILLDKIDRCERVAVRYSGEIFIDKDDKYTFYTLADDGIRVIIDDKKIIDAWVQHAVVEIKKEIELKRGWHKILIEYFQWRNNAILEFYYSGSDLQKKFPPPEYLRPGK